jgi:hypothetical protein
MKQGDGGQAGCHRPAVRNYADLAAVMEAAGRAGQFRHE